MFSLKTVEKTEINNRSAVIEIKHLKKSFEENVVLNDINLCLRKGENLVVLGKSGTGKSVLIKCIAGLMYPDAGKLMVLGKSIPDLNPDELDELRKKIGFLFQSAALYDSMTVRENLEFPLVRHLHEKSAKKIDQMVEEALENVGLIDAIDKTPGELSGGMRKRVGLARTLIMRPEIMLYDEPTTGLDPVTSNEISHLILDMQQKYNTSSIIITHDMPCANITGNRLMIMKEGSFVAEGSYHELEKSSDQWVRAFFN
jgi:phospholipid/cholesterol/gamma-HCH transport system ATP-binding protein